MEPLCTSVCVHTFIASLRMAAIKVHGKRDRNYFDISLGENFLGPEAFDRSLGILRAHTNFMLQFDCCCFSIVCHGPMYFCRLFLVFSILNNNFFFFFSLLLLCFLLLVRLAFRFYLHFILLAAVRTAGPTVA